MRRTRIQSLTRWFLLLLIIAFPNQWAFAQAKYPSKAIEIVNSFSPGGVNDLNIRALETVAEKHLGVPIVQVFKPGGGGIAGTTEVAHSTPDGYKLLAVSSGELTAGPNLTKTTYTLDSFAFIARVSLNPYALVVRSASPWKSFNDFRREAAKQPGKLTIGTTPTGGVFLTAQYFLKRGGISLNSVPYPGAGPFIAALLGGHLDSAWTGLAAAEAHLNAGTLRLLAVTGADRTKDHPNAPTFNELGVDSPFVQWIGVVAPRKIAKERLGFLRSTFERITKDPAYIKAAKNLGIDVAYLPGEEFEKLVRDEDVKFKALVKDLGLEPK